MKQIVIISAVLTVITVAIFGCLYIFDIMSSDAVFNNLFKIVAAIVLLGGCAALITALTGKKE